MGRSAMFPSGDNRRRRTPHLIVGSFNAIFQSLVSISSWPAPALFARRTRKNEGVYVDTRLSDDADLRANRTGPEGCS